MQQQEVAPVVDAKPQPQDKQATKVLPTLVVEAFTQALEEAQATGEPVAEIAAAMVDVETIKSEIIEGGSEGRPLVITAEPENTETTMQPESDVPAKKPTGKGRGKKGAASTEDAGK